MESATCNICITEIDEEVKRNLCYICAGIYDACLENYTEDFTAAGLNGKDALRLLVLRIRLSSFDKDAYGKECVAWAWEEKRALEKRAAELLERLPASFEPWWKNAWSPEKECEVSAARQAENWAFSSTHVSSVQRLAAMFSAEKHKVKLLEAKAEDAMKQKVKELEEKHAKVVAKIQQARTEDMKAMEERHWKQQRQENAKYAECLAPLIGVRDKMQAECEKKVEDARRRGYAMGYASADQKWNPVYMAVCEELELVRKEGENHQAGYIRLIGERDELVVKEADLMQELDEIAEANEKFAVVVEELRMELASAKGNLEGTEVAERAVAASATQVIEGLRKELTTTKADLIRAQDSAEELNEELAAVQKELSGWCERCMATQNAAKKLEGEVDAATKLFQVMRADHEALRAENKALQQKAEEDKQMVQRHLKEVDKGHAEMMAWEKERQQEEYKDLQKKHAGLLQLVNPTIKLMKSNPELFGGEALPSGGASPRPPAIVRLSPVKEENNEKALNFLRSVVTPSRACLLVESPTSALPGIVEVEPSTEGLCIALPGPPLPASPPPSPLVVPDEPKACGAAGCIDCPPAEPEAKPKPNYNHPNWPSPITKRFAKHLAKHSGLRSPWQSHDPKSIRTHEDALEYIAKRVNISVENLLQWTMKHYQSFYDPWTLVEGPSKFKMGPAPATWWC
jgi:hypothetical protein